MEYAAGMVVYCCATCWQEMQNGHMTTPVPFKDVNGWCYFCAGVVGKATRVGIGQFWVDKKG